MQRVLLLLLGVFWHFQSAFAQGSVPVPAAAYAKTVVIKGGTAHIGNGEVLENATIIIEKGKITGVSSGAGAVIPPNAEVIDATGKHVYPGLIAPNSTIGLREIDAVRASIDYAEIGLYNPHIRAISAYNAESRITPTIRSNGVLLAQVVPQGGVISGTSSVVQLDAWNWEDAEYRADDAVYLNWPAHFTTSGWWAEPGSTERTQEREEKMHQLSRFFSNARAYREAPGTAGYDQRLASMRGLFEGKQRLFIRANKAREMMEAVLFAKEQGVKHVVLVGANDAGLIADFLKQHNVPVVLDRLHELPKRPEEDPKQQYKMPKQLQDAGVLFCLSYQGDMEVMGSRNLPFLAGTAAAYGLTKEQALQSVSLNTARILGIDSRTGSIEVGKDATLFISSGDALDMRSNNVELALIQGRPIDLDNHQKQLYQKYRNKYQTPNPAVPLQN